MTKSPSDRVRRNDVVRTAVTVVAFAFASAMFAWCVVLTEVSSHESRAKWLAFAIAGTAVLSCELSRAAWIRLGPTSFVTPLAMISFVMMQIGSASLTLATVALGATLHSLRRRSSPSDTIIRIAGATLSIAGACFVLATLNGGVGVSVIFDDLSWTWALAVGVGGLTMVVLDAATIALWMSARRRISVWSLVNRELLRRVTAEITLISLAPLWVVVIHDHVVLVPFMAATTALVFLATRQAVQQAHEARYDPLTGLLNRTAFLELVDEALTGKGDHPSIVFLMDLNGFKDVNDRLGHPMGDALLVAFAERLEAGRPSHSHAARLGGDEFAIIADGNSRDPEELAAGLHHYLTEPLTLEGLPVTVGVSIGLAVSGRDGHTTSDLVRAADTAMYKAKRTSASFASYDSGTRSPQHGRRNLLADLNEAITAGQLHLNFQPQLRMVDGAVDTIEALVRWQHPEHGAIPPSEFIGLAEQTDLIRPITDLVIRTATHSLMSGDSAVRLAVNVSARSLEDKMFAPEVFEILDETGFPAYRLELEVTERALAENAERIRYTVSKLRDAGIRVAIDDFGSGSSSYQTLRMLDVDRIKIDRSLVQGILASERDRTIVRSLVVLAHELGLDVVAEGIESSRVWNALIEMGCDVGQGFGIAVPMADAATHDWLTQWDSVALAEPPLPRRIRFANLDQ